MKLDMGDAAIIAALADAALCVVYAVMVEVRERRRKKALRQAIEDARRDAAEQIDDSLVAYSWGAAHAYAQVEKLLFGRRKQSDTALQTKETEP